MTHNNLANRAAVALFAALVAVVAAVLGASSASATVAHRASVLVRAGTTSQTAGCPQTTSFAARIVSDGPALVRYHWRRSDGAVSTNRTLRFRGAGRHTRTVRDSWGPASDDYSGWEQLVVTNPDRVVTRQLRFATSCATHIAIFSAGATSSSAVCDDVYTDLDGMVNIGGTIPPGVRYYWTVDGTVVGDTTITDPATLAGDLNLSYHYAFIPPAGTTGHYVVLYVEATDGSAFAASLTESFTTTCA
jgi:hypothetical protein